MVLKVLGQCKLTGCKNSVTTATAKQIGLFLPQSVLILGKSKVKSNYFIVRPKVDQRTGLLSLPHFGNFRRTHAHHICLYFVSIHQRATTGAQRCAPLVRLLTTHLPTPEGWKAELA